jgi:hypothetical protein
MEREIQSFLHHPVRQQPRRMYHHPDIARFHREYQVKEACIPAYTREFEGRFHHAFRGVAVSRHDAAA